MTDSEPAAPNTPAQQPQRSRSADALAAVLLPASCVVGAIPAAVVVVLTFTAMGAEPPGIVVPAAALAGAVLGFTALSSVLEPPVPAPRRFLAVLAGVAAFVAAGKLIPFSMVDDKRYPFSGMDILEEAVLLCGAYGSLFIATFVVLRWPWTEHDRL